MVRAWFVVATEVEFPIRGDIRGYVSYAWNLVEHGVFSMAAPSAEAPAPDAFRGPGFPLLLAATMLLGGTEGGWYPLALAMQVAMGAATALLAVLLSRRFLGDAWALLAGVLVALQPHHVAATGALLTEVAYGFFLMLGLWLAYRSLARCGLPLALLAGSAFGFAYLINQVVLLFPLLAAGVLAVSGYRRQALAVAAAALVFVAGWSLRNAFVEPQGDGPGRVTINFVQGSWPVFHQAFASRHAHEVPRRIIAEVDSEIASIHEDPAKGIARVLGRFAQQPGTYLAWYGWQKPYLFWAWDIRVGYGDVYFHKLSNSPLDKWPLRGTKLALEFANPLLFALSAAAAIALLIGFRRGQAQGRIAFVLLALMAVYVTAVHWVLQAEPRYAIPYRPEQIMLGVSTLAWLWKQATSRAGRPRTTPAPA